MLVFRASNEKLSRTSRRPRSLISVRKRRPSGSVRVNDMMPDQNAPADFLGLTTEIVCAYIGNNSLTRAELPSLVGAVHSSLARVGSGRGHEPAEAPIPAVPFRKSVTPDYMVCL